MIPRLNLQETLKQDYASFLEALGKTDFSGEIRTDYGARLITATDNSIYQILPQAVVFPRTAEDVSILFRLAHAPQFKAIQFSPRGGGTGTNGQSLSSGIIVDCSKHMNCIVAVNLQEGWVRVQPGVVLDQLNAHLKPHGVFFAPDLSPSNRATLGGMVNTDACGKGSRIYGRTSNHVLELSYVLHDGTAWSSSEMDLQALSALKKRNDVVGRVHQKVDEIVTQKQALIGTQFPKMSRFLTGYNLAKVYSEKRDRFNLNYLLAGSEGTLAVITEAKLKLTPLPQVKQLLVVKYRSFQDALKDAQLLLANNPSAIETIDEKILSLAKQDALYSHVKDFIKEEGNEPPCALNLVEFAGEDQKNIEENIQNLCATIEKNRAQPHQAMGYYHTKSALEMSHLWNLRKKGVGLLGNTAGNRKPLPFVEDTAVPPENLAAYIAEFTALLQEHGLEYGMFGHVDVGCLHVRPALDMKDPHDEKLVRTISDNVVRLVQKYGGVMWAEHGRGYRSEYTPLFFGQELYQDLRRIKEAFDPDNQLNPGKIVTPYSMREKVVSVEAPLRGHFDRQITPALQADYESTLNCNGNGICFNYDPDDLMCPSSKITRDRIHSPKGRAGIMREWLRQLSLVQPQAIAQSQTVLAKEGFKNKVRRGVLWLQKLQNTRAKRQGMSDFSEEVYAAMAGCLACKACAVQCPIHVDVPEFRSKFLELYHTRYLRPVRDYLIGWIEMLLPLQAQAAPLNNRLLQAAPMRVLLNQFVGLCDLPPISRPSVKSGLNRRHAPPLDETHLQNLTAEEKARSVILLQDAFTTYFEASLVLDIYDLLRMLGYVVYVAPVRPNGKPLHVKGFLKEFRELAAKNESYLARLNRLGLAMVGIEPSMVLTYRDEYPKVLEQEKLNFHVFLLQEWLHSQMPRLQKLLPLQESSRHTYQLLGHCQEKTGALDSQNQWQAIYQAFGLQLDLLKVGCCGMCGTYGHESEHHFESKGIYFSSWGKCVQAAEKNRQALVVSGYSCRSQIKRFDAFTPLHPAQALFQELSHWGELNF